MHDDLWAAGEKLPQGEDLTLEYEKLLSEYKRLKKIIDTPNPENFLEAVKKETKYQISVWGSICGDPVAFGSQDESAFVALIDHLAVKALETSDSDYEKKLHRITTVAAAAANWHQLIINRKENNGK